MKENFDRILRFLENKINGKIANIDYNYVNFFNFVKKIMEENPNATNKEVDDYISKSVDEIQDKIYKIEDIRNEIVYCNAISYLRNNPAILRKYYEKYKDFDTTDYTDSQEQNVIYTIKTKESFRNAFLDVLKYVREEEAAGNVDKTQEFDMVQFVINSLQKPYEDGIKEKSIENITSIIEILDKFTSLDDYVSKHNAKCKYYGIEALNLCKTSNDKNNPGLLEIYKKENLEKINLDKLMVLETFWINRVVKEIEKVNDAKFALKELDLYDRIRNSERDSNGNVFVNFTDDEKRFICTKNAVITNMVKSIYAYQTYNLKENPENDNFFEEEGKKYFPVDQMLQRIDLQIGGKYKKYFNDIFPGKENDILKDIESCEDTEQLIANLYDVKDDDIISVLESLNLSNSLSNNWGIMQEEKKSGKILIGADIEGFNMPLRIHINKRDLMDFLKTKNNNTFMRVYAGASDFFFDDSLIKTNLMFPFTKKQKKFLKSKDSSKVNFFFKDCFEHLQYLADNRRFPEHLKSKKKIQRKSGNKDIIEEKKIIPNVMYVDLATGEYYARDISGNYTKIEKKEKRNTDFER